MPSEFVRTLHVRTFFTAPTIGHQILISRQNESEIDNFVVQLWTSKLVDKGSHPVLGHFIFLLSELLKNLVQDRLSAIERRPQIALGLNGNN